MAWYTVDATSSDGRIAFEFDGDYWHSRSARRDAQKDEFLASRGIRVIRIRESLYKSHPEEAVGLVLAETRKTGYGRGLLGAAHA